LKDSTKVFFIAQEAQDSLFETQQSLKKIKNNMRIRYTL